MMARVDYAIYEKSGIYVHFLSDFLILDRIVHDTHRMELVGESLRSRQISKISENVETD